LEVQKPFLEKVSGRRRQSGIGVLGPGFFFPVFSGHFLDGQLRCGDKEVISQLHTDLDHGHGENLVAHDENLVAHNENLVFDVL
jgi:hypothetical protein